jgi:superfamily I DNA/RNA helicase/RecB family exonuclease
MRSVTGPLPFLPDERQGAVLAHDRGPLLVTGAPGTGKTAVLRERFARLIEGGADPERVGLVVRSGEDRVLARADLLARLSRPLPEMKVMTVHGLAHHVLGQRHSALGYERAPDVLSNLDQAGRVGHLLDAEDPAEWPTYWEMLSLRGFADEVRQFLLRAQEALVKPEEILARALATRQPGWRELATFYERYLSILDAKGEVDFAGLLNQAAAALAESEPVFDHLLVDDSQEATFAEEALVVRAAGTSLVVAGDPGSHVFSFQGTTDVPIRRFVERIPVAGEVTLDVDHRCPSGRPALEAWSTAHTSEEHAAVAREARRIHVAERVPWDEIAVVVRRHGPHVAGLLRALDDAGVPRTTSAGGLSALAEPAVLPFVTALQWIARPLARDGLVETLLTSELGRLSPAAARGLVRAAHVEGLAPGAALDLDEGLTAGEASEVEGLRATLEEAERLGSRSVLDAFRRLWTGLAYSARLVEAAEGSAAGRRDLDAVLAFSRVVARAGDREDASVESFLEMVEGGDGPGLADPADPGEAGAVRVVTAHATAGREFDTVIVVDATEGNYPSLSRREPLFDLASLDGPVAQSERNRRRLEDERRLFGVVVSRARRRVIFTASDPHGEEDRLSARSRFVADLGTAWTAAPRATTEVPLSRAEAAASWRRALASGHTSAAHRLASLRGLLALGDRPGRWWHQRDWSRTGQPLHGHVRVSYSKLDTLENCELQFLLSEELGLGGQAGYHAWVGHLVHSLIDECEKGKIERSLAALVAEADMRWSSKEFPSRAVSEAFRRSVTTVMLPAWFACYGETPAPEPEFRFEFEFEGATVAGQIDRVSALEGGGCQITDYKTGKSRNAPPSEDNLQLGIYFLAVNRSPELEPFRPVKAVELAFLKEEHGPKWTQLGMTSQGQREFGERMAARLGGLIHRIADLNQDGGYAPSATAQCRWCDFKTLCPLWPEGRELFPVGPETATR